MVFAQSFVSLALVLPSCMLPRVLPGWVPLPRNRDPRANPNQESFTKGEAGKLGLLVNSPVGSPGGREKQHGELCSWDGGGDGGDLERTAHTAVPGLRGDRVSSWMCTRE